jgi:hypothetical protein
VFVCALRVCVPRCVCMQGGLVRERVCVCVLACACMCVRVRVSVRAHAHTHTHSHTHTHKQTHTQTHALKPLSLSLPLSCTHALTFSQAHRHTHTDTHRHTLISLPAREKKDAQARARVSMHKQSLTHRHCVAHWNAGAQAQAGWPAVCPCAYGPVSCRTDVRGCC